MPGYCVRQFIIAALAAFLAGCGSSSISSSTSGSNSNSDNSSNNAATDTTVNSANDGSSLGINLSAYVFTSPSYGMIDIFTKSMVWYPNFCSSHTSLTTDGNGWVTSLQTGQCAVTLLQEQLSGNYPSGTYVMLWEGDGSFTIERDATYSHTEGDSVSQSNGLNRATFDVTPTNQGLYMEITSVTSGDHLRNIRIIPPGGICGRSATDLDYMQACQSSRGGTGSCDSGETCYDFEEVYWDRFSDAVSDMHNPKAVFHPAFLDRLKTFRAVRVMQWLSMDANTVQDWADRASLTKQTFGDDADWQDDKSDPSRGVPYEVAFALANALDADLWLNIPAQATDNYVTQLATLAQSNLESGRKVYLEYSNEVWNSDYAVDRAYALARANADADIPSSDSDTVKIAKWVSQRSVEMFALWDTVFGTDAATRLIKTLPTFNVDTVYTTALLDWQNAYQSADALAVNGYFAGELISASAENTILGWANSSDLTSLFSEINSGVIGSQSALAEADSYYASLQTMASDRNLIMVAYEGGPGLYTHIFSSANQSAIFDFYKTANRDTRMGTALSANLTNWKDAGGNLFFHFVYLEQPSDYGDYAALDYQTETRANAPKWDAALSFMENNTCWWTGCQ